MPSESRNRFLLLYGSQTGQAKAIAEEIQEKSEHFGLQADLHCFSQTEKKFNLERERCVVIVVSTTGDGEPPDTVLKFWRRLNKRTLTDTHLQQLYFSLLGLGDSNYTNFCKCSKNLDRRLEQLGAKRFFPCAWADDGVGLEVVAEPWIESVIPAVREFLGLSPITVQSSELIVKGDNPDVSQVADSDEIIRNGQEATVANGSQPKEAVDSKDLNISSMDRTSNISADNMTEQRGLTASISNGHDLPVGDTADGEGLTACLTSPSPSLKDSILTIPLLPPPFLNLTFTGHKLEILGDLPYQNGCALPSAASPVSTATVVSARRLTRDDAVKTALCLSLLVDPSVLHFQPGDSISVICPNTEEEITQLLDRLDLTDVADQQYELCVMTDTKKRRAAIPGHIPPTSTLRHTLRTCVDFRQPPKKALVRTLVEFTSNPVEKRRLQELCSKQGGQEYTQFVHTDGTSLLDILVAFPSCHPTAERLLEHLPRLQPRPYSVASSPLSQSDQLDIVFNILEMTAGGRRCQRRGVCTGWLDQLTADIQITECTNIEENLAAMRLRGDKIQVPVFARTSQNFHMPEDLSIPLIMIGPGTGVAPFVGFLQHRECLLKQLNHEDVGETWLFFGCRHRDRDFLFREEFERLKMNGTLSKLCVSFSRDQDRGDNPRYVQDNLRIHTKQILTLIEEKNAVIYVCGDAKHMAKNVNDEIVLMYQTYKDLSEGDARSAVLSLRLHRRYLEDVWT